MVSEAVGNKVVRAGAGLALVWILFFAATMYCYDFRFSWLVNAGAPFIDHETVDPDFHYLKKAGGYDGQFYYRLAFNPFTTRRADHGIILDLPALRQQRLVYPLLVWIASLGGRANVPLMLLLVNLALLVGLCFAGAKLAAQLGYDPTWGLLFCMFPGLVGSLKMDLTEPSYAFFLVLYLLMQYQNRQRLAAAALALAMLSRETAVIVAIGKAIELAYVYVRGGDAPGKRVFWTLFPFVPFALWQGWLWMVWGEAPLLASSHANVGAPFSGIIKYAGWLMRGRDAHPVVDFMHVAMVAIMGFSALWVCVRRRGLVPPSHVLWLLAYFSIFFVMGNPWNETFLRVFTDFFIVSAYIFLQLKPGWAGRMLPAMTATWMALTMSDSIRIDFYAIRMFLK